MPAAVTAGLSYAVGAAVPLLATYVLPHGARVLLSFLIVLVALGFTSWFAAWLTELSAWRLVRRNLLLGTATMAVSVLVGNAVDL